MQKLEPPDSFHFDAAVGWLGLGAAGDARHELEQISPEHQNRADVLEIRWLVNIQEQRWSEALQTAEIELHTAPTNVSGWLHRAYALRRIQNGGLHQAWEALVPAADKFPQEPVVAFNLSCYACQLGQLDAARVWLKCALKIGGAQAIKTMALADEDLKPLWPEIKEL